MSNRKIIAKTVRVNNDRGYIIVKRLFDFIASFACIVLLSPVFFVVTVLIYMEDKGNIIFVQERSGLNNTVFKIFKFRSMVINATAMHAGLSKYNEMDGPAFKMKHDPRITKVGSFIRKTSIDELPQLFNVLKGDMSLVGPRPLPTYETAECNDYQLQRLLVKPGITCYWQVSGRNDISFDEWMELDLKYINEASFITDIKILLMTVKAVLNGKGAY